MAKHNSNNNERTSADQRELEIALELSKRTFIEEEARRHVENASDLMQVEDPVVLERNRQIEQIKQLITAQNRNGIIAGLSGNNPFLRDFNVARPQLMMPGLSPSSSYFQNSNFYSVPPCTPYSPSPPLHSCASSSAATTTFTSNKPISCPFIDYQQQYSRYSSSTHQSQPIHQPITSHNQLPSSSSTVILTSGPALTIQTSETLLQNKQQNSPLKVPFRHHGSDLIDLRSPRTVKSIAIEEFDPLYIKMKQLFADKKEEQKPCCSTSSETTPKAEEATRKFSTVNRKGNRSETSLERRRASKQSNGRKSSHTLLTCASLKSVNGPKSDFHKEKQLLAEECQRLAPNTPQNVFFWSPLLNYFVAEEESTIKLLVHQDDTWPRDTPEEPRRLMFTCGVRNTSEEILQKVLLDLLPAETLARNGGAIPSEEYALKVFGSDEFLVREAPIGKHPFVANFLAKGKDVELEVGKSRLPLTPTPLGAQKRLPPPTYPTVNADLFRTFRDTLANNVEKCLSSPEDTNLRQPVLQSIKMITTFMNNVQPMDLVSAIDMLYAAQSPSALNEAVSFIVTALVRLFRAYCCSSLADFSVPDPEIEENVPKETRDASICDDKLLLRVESAHNLPAIWRSKYKHFYVEAHLMYGPKSYGMSASSPHPVISKTKYHFCYAPVELWAEFDVHISALPRESQVCLILRGVPLAEETESGSGANSSMSSGYSSSRCSANCESGVFAHRLASASLPLYNVDELLLQGPVMVPLRQMEDDVVHPWGPRPLIRHPEEPVLIVRGLEYDYHIQFPKVKAPTETYWREFNSISEEEQETLHTLCENATSQLLTDDDKELLWSNRSSLHHFPKALPLVLASSFAWGAFSLGNIYALLDKWAVLPPPVAVELLLPYFQDKKVREYAIRCIGGAPSEFLFNFLAQFVEALRYETFEHSPLALFLLSLCTTDRRFAFELYWQLQHRIGDARNPSYAARCQLLQQTLLELNIPSFANEIAFQHLFLDILDKVASNVKQSADGAMNKVLHKELSQMSDKLDIRCLRIPIAPGFRCCAVSISECTIFNSLTKPIKLVMRGQRATFGVIYKAGDDLRQDEVVTKLVRAMNDIWLGEQLDLRMVLFRCLPTGAKKGLIELVPNCNTLREIQIVGGAAGVFRDEVLSEWLARQNPSEFQYKAALENFRRSCAGWCVATYVLGIGDRHNDNILVTTNGHVFHIDFGKYMGDWQMAAGFKRDRVPFVFTPEMAYVINGGQSSTEHFQRFVDECCQALNLLRRNSSAIVNIMRFLSCSDIPGMSMDSVAFVENNLMLDLSDVQATVLFTRMIEESLQSRFPRLNFFAHTLAQFKGNPLSQISGGKAEDMNRLSFISELYTEKEEGRIESVHVSAYEKWHVPEKIYMYKLLVKRAQENVSTEIYRTFAEFQELHWKLCFRFSSRAIPPLSHTLTVGRTNIRAVAVRRQVDLQYFLQRLFALSDEVAHSELVYTFLHPIYRDTEPEARKLNGVPDIRPDALAQCQLLLRISWDEAQRELGMFVGHAKNLPLVGREQAPDSYVKMYLRWSGDMAAQKQWKRKTQVVRNAQNPTYNAEICYALSGVHGHRPVSLSALSLDVAIWHSGNAVFKDNFQLCETHINLDELLSTAGGGGAAAKRKGLREMESWFTLRPACALSRT